MNFSTMAVGTALAVATVVHTVITAAEAKDSKVQEGGVWSALRIIDVHAHCGTFAGYDLSEKTLLDNIRRYGISKALVSNIDGAELPGVTGCLSERQANEQCARLVARHAGVLRGLLWCRPGDGQVSTLEKFLAARDSRPIFVGIKLHPEMNQFRADSPSVDPYLSLCEKHHLAAVVHCGADSSESAPQLIYALARRHPTVPVVLYHMGFGTDHKSAMAVVKEAAAKKDAQLYLETSQCSGPEAVEAVKSAGASRVLFGTDATYYGAGHYRRYEEQVAALKQELAPEDLDKVLRGNALRLFHLQ